MYLLGQSSGSATRIDPSSIQPLKAPEVEKAQKEFKEKVTGELNEGYLSFSAILKATAYTVRQIANTVFVEGGRNISEIPTIFATAIIYFSNERSQNREAGSILGGFLKSESRTSQQITYGTPDEIELEKGEAKGEKITSSSASICKSTNDPTKQQVKLTIEGSLSSSDLEKILAHKDFNSITSLEISECILSDEDWKRLSDALPSSLQIFKLHTTYVTKAVGKTLGKKLGTLPIKEFRIDLPPRSSSESKRALEEKQEGLRELWKTFAHSELKDLTSLGISNHLATGPKEWELTTLMLYKCLVHGHTLPASQIGSDGEINHQHVRQWLEAAQIVNINNLIRSIPRKELDAIPLDKWASYDSLAEAIRNKLRETS